MKLPLDKIYPNPDQPRKFFHPGKLEELAQSIKESGLMEPLIVVKRGEGYMIIAGERRWRACKIAGVMQIPVIVKKADDQTVAELSLLENLQREDLSIVEEAKAYQGLIDMGMSHEEIARKLGIKQVWQIQERLNLLKLLPVFQEYTIKNILSPSQAQELSRLPKDLQGIVFDKIAAGKANTYNKLRSLVNAMLFVQEQESFLPEPTEKEKQVSNRYDRMIEELTNFVRRSFNSEEMKVLASVLTPQAKVNIDKIDLIDVPDDFPALTASGFMRNHYGVNPDHLTDRCARAVRLRDGVLGVGSRSDERHEPRAHLLPQLLKTAAKAEGFTAGREEGVKTGAEAERLVFVVLADPAEPPIRSTPPL